MPDPVAGEVRAAAAAAPSIDALRSAVLGCTACPSLAGTRQHVVVGTLPPGADVVLLGEAPGAEEDRLGEPFFGRSGQLLDRLLGEAGLPRSSVGVVNVLKCRPPGNRRPAAIEAARCRGWLDRQLALADPAVLVPLGGSATEAVLGRGAQVTKVRGRAWAVDGRLVVPTYHPSAALRFGPRGEPLRLLAGDLGAVAALSAVLRRAAARLSVATVADAAELREVMRAAYAGPPLDPPTGALRETLADVADELAARGGVVARRDGAIVGGLRFQGPRPGSDAQWIHRVAVAPSAQGSGVGTALMQWAHAVARSAGFGEARLGVRTARPGNREFYERLGYAVVADHGFWHEMAVTL